LTRPRYVYILALLAPLFVVTWQKAAIHVYMQFAYEPDIAYGAAG